MLIKLFLIILCFISTQALAKPLVTGWHKILVNDQHSGYLIQEFSFDDAKKQFTATNFARINLNGSEMQRSLRSVATDKLVPVSFQYTEQVGNKTKLVDASYDKNILTVKITESGAPPQSKQMQINKGTFSAIFLYMLMITNKSGIKKGHHFSYSAIAEDKATVHVGTADVEEITTIDGLEVFKVKNVFDNSRTIEHVTPSGQIVRTKDPFSNVETRLVESKTDAVGAFPYADKSIQILFGQVPDKSFPAPITAVSAPTTTLNNLPKGVSAPPSKYQKGP